MDKHIYTIEDSNGSTSDYDADEYAYVNGNRNTDAWADSDAGAGYAPEHRSEPTGFAGHDTERDAASDGDANPNP